MIPRDLEQLKADIERDIWITLMFGSVATRRYMRSMHQRDRPRHHGKIRGKRRKGHLREHYRALERGELKFRTVKMEGIGL